MSIEESRKIITWLNSKKYHTFQPVDKEYDNVVFRGTFPTISYIRKNNYIYGLEVNFTTDKPYAYSSDITVHKYIRDDNKKFSIYNSSDDEDYVSTIKLKIKIIEDGDLIITSLPEDRATIIKNCTANEEITIDCETKVLATSNEEHQLFNDFNFIYPRLHPEYMDNIFTCSINCDIEVVYCVPLKVGILCQ